MQLVFRGREWRRSGTGDRGVTSRDDVAGGGIGGVLEILPEDLRDDERANGILAVEPLEMRRSLGEVGIKRGKLFPTRTLPELSEFDEGETLLVSLGHLQQSQHLVCCFGPNKVKDFELRGRSLASEAVVTTV